MVEKRDKRDLDSLSCLKHRELCTAVHSTVKNVNLVHNAVTKNEMRAWEDLIASLFRSARASCTTSGGPAHPPVRNENLDPMYTGIYAS